MEEGSRNIGPNKRDEYEIEEKKAAAAEVESNYSTFLMTCIGHHLRPADLRMHLIKEISGIPTSLNKVEQTAAASPQPPGTASSSAMRPPDKNESFRALLHS